MEEQLKKKNCRILCVSCEYFQLYDFVGCSVRKQYVQQLSKISNKLLREINQRFRSVINSLHIFISYCGCCLKKCLVTLRQFDKTTLTNQLFSVPLLSCSVFALQMIPTPTIPSPSTAAASLSSTGPTSQPHGPSSSCGNWSRYWGNCRTYSFDVLACTVSSVFIP